jgi:hypothetical protein
MTIPHLTQRTTATCYPLALLAALGMLVWTQHRYHEATAAYAGLQHMFAGLFHSAYDQAQEAFTAGDFQRTVTVLDTAGPSAASDPRTLMLRARALECMGFFEEAACVYTQLEAIPGKHLAITRGQKFCQRMASEHTPNGVPSKEMLYRLHVELMRRGDAASARYIARRLLPDLKPLRESILALLREYDHTAKVTVAPDPGLMNITIPNWHPEMVALLRNLPIANLDISQSGIQDVSALAGLDIRSLNLSDNSLSDLSVLRSIPLHVLRLDHSNIADVHALAGMPLREANLSHTLISSLLPLSLSPLQKLDISSTAVRSLEPLSGMELHELDLSHTRVTDLTVLASMPLERLALNDTGVHDLRALAGAQLKYLSLANTPVKDLEILAGMPLVELDLRGCELLTDLAPLANCAQLERVYLPRKISAPADHWQLSRLRFIGEDRGIELAKRTP